MFIDVFKKIAIPTIKAALWLIDPDHRQSDTIETDDTQKFTHVIPQNFASDFGTAVLAMRTVPYPVWELRTETHTLRAADRHRVMREDGSPVWLEDLRPGDHILTENGPETVVSCRDLGVRVHMYSLQVETDDPNDANNHLYYTDGILSHNTTCAAAYLLWRAMFVPDSTILITANKYLQALEIMDRIRYGYENLPDQIRAGVVEYNKGTLAFDNGSKIVSRATSGDAGRGLSVSLLYCLSGDSKVTVRHKITGVVEEISLVDLHERLGKTE